MRNLKKILALALALVMTLSVMSVASAKSLGEYADASSVSAKHAVAVDVATQLGILEGVTATNYAPQGTLTRAQLATMIYRITTGDVKGTYVSNFAAGAAAKFSDVKADAWYAGYVGYCADAGYLQGWDGKYAPNNTLTGYQALAALLRAIGYNQPGEFTGADWTVRVAQIATQSGVSANVVTDLNKAITREQAAEFIYNALFADQVTYTPAFGYTDSYWVANDGSLAYEVFSIQTGKLGVAGVTIDDWGRPGTVWYTKSGDATVVIADKALATYYTEAKECQVASDIGLDEATRFVVYTNGASNKSYYTIDPVDTVYGIGDQGRLTQVYADRIVKVDTYLAEVTSVTPARYDAAGHQIIAAANGLKVYDNTTGNNYSIAGNNYVVGQYILISIVESNGSFVAKKYIDKGLAETLVGAQTVLFSNAKQHVVNGATYDDAHTFYLNQAGSEVVNHTWYFDEYKNLIGATDISAIYDYGTIKNIQWINPVGANGYAQATITMMDGTDKTMTVKALVSGTTTYPLTYWNANGTGNASVKLPYVSTNIAENYAEYAAKHLYQVEANPDGSVNLVLVQNITAPKVIGDELNLADVKSGVSAIVGNEGTIYTNANTQYLVRVATPVADVYTFTAIAGYAAIGNYTGTDVVVDYVDKNGDGFAEYVYVIGTPDSAAAKGLFFLTSTNVKTVLLANNVVDYYELTGYVDGVLGTIKTSDYTIVTKLVNKAGTMATVNYTNGKVVDVREGIVDWTDLSALGGAYTGMELSSRFLTPDTLGTGVTANCTAVLDGTVLKVTKNNRTASYNMESVVAIGSALADGPVTDKIIYVVYNNIGGIQKAATVYVLDYTISNDGASSIPNNWVPNTMSNGDVYYVNSVTKQLYTTSYTALISDLTGYWGGNGTVLYSTGDGYTYSATGNASVLNMTIASALANGWTLTLVNSNGVWQVI